VRYSLRAVRLSDEKKLSIAALSQILPDRLIEQITPRSAKRLTRIGTGRAADRQTALDFGAQEFVDLDNDTLEDVGEVDLVFESSAATSGSGPQA
jgi:hypothetical protein